MKVYMSRSSSTDAICWSFDWYVYRACKVTVPALCMKARCRLLYHINH